MGPFYSSISEMEKDKIIIQSDLKRLELDLKISL